MKAIIVADMKASGEFDEDVIAKRVNMMGALGRGFTSKINAAVDEEEAEIVE